ncbi:FAD-binding protein [Cellulosimicrobium marinum]|uniref:FAD-binding protein n=1 Tax=Cellulosimicrobium marinum TaxID=1638992 RepID=UPI001E2A7351|nr:FAD-binding protein [Cellulosimicrobium marinum]MCB7135021.1 FAD-binding protein [Cellulosimicrobium marinum]
MTRLRVEHADVVVVGGGAAGLSAALAVAQDAARAAATDEGSRAPVVALVSKVYPMRSHTVAAEGGAAGVVGDDDSLEQHVADTLAGGAGLCEEDAVRFVVERAAGELWRLENWGLPWSRTDDGHVAVRRFGGMSRARTWFAADKTGFHLLHTLFQTSLRYSGDGATIRRYDEHHVLDLVLDDAVSPGSADADDGPGGRVRGVVVHDQHRGEPLLLAAPAVVLATGGAARAWGTSTNAGIVTGDGTAMALRAGAPLRDLEFLQFHPTGLPGNGILLTEAARGEGGVLLDADGRRYLADYGLGPETPVGEPVPRTMELGPRDRLSQAFWHADRDGRTIPTPDGGVVLLDLRHLGRARLADRLPLVSGLAKQFAGVDPALDPVPVRPTAHYTMGGIRTDAHGATRIGGLFAAGECASTGLHGANRLGSNSLVETLVVGRAAGEAALAWSRQASAGRVAGGASSAGGGVGLGSVEADVVDRAAAVADAYLAMRGRGSEPPAAIRAELGRVLDADVGIYRDADGLRRALATVEDLRARYADVRVADTGAVLNTDWATTVELGATLLVAHAAVLAALAREESRGAHQRLDFPATDDAPRHSEVRLGADGAVEVTHVPVGLRGTGWPAEHEVDVVNGARTAATSFSAGEGA